LLFDLYGTNHDDRVWPQPYRFRPRRFETTDDLAYTLVPQGAGEHPSTHRCPGENLTLAAVTTSIRCLAAVSYHLPVQDLGYPLNRMPSLPRSGLLLDRVADHA
jgi:fatty-acid peroxygenase